jgi:hypothetical protein
LLLGYLFFKRRQRFLNQPLREDPEKWTRTTFDVAKVKPRVDGLRGDYLAAPRPSAQTRWYRYRLLAVAARALSQLSFFREQVSADHQKLTSGLSTSPLPPSFRHHFAISVLRFMLKLSFTISAP